MATKDVVVLLHALADEIKGTSGEQILRKYAERTAMGATNDHIAFCYRLKEMRRLPEVYSAPERSAFELAYEEITGQRMG